ncbi:P-loop containing nucleoside triphosphate hydrolase protein [Boletus edulis BED1]|uniref:P-loop containing nucleoside triphosphate hydrolase protein n=1 Tax=Boletus edulis BED1 TaxID=1328754 RepID=A0AAD4BSB3_BOLED|nr:P-loop containing nucleoside triphosphate hydrolase protein [Boletus edulis BED1]
MVSDESLTPNISPCLTIISESPLLPAASHVTSSSHQHPPNLPGSSVPDNDAVCGAQSNNRHHSIDVDDIVIAVMGITRSGKSTFINQAAGRMEIMINNDLQSQTRAVRPVRCLHPDGRRNVVLVDTPGFDDTYLSDAQILRIITHWLKETYENNIKLSGLLYLHRISDNRMAGASVKDLAVFKDLCGKNNLKNVILVTTMWDEVEDQSVGSKREKHLLSVFWKDMIRRGSCTRRFQGTHESAWEIIDRLDLGTSGQRRTPLQIQQEMVDRGLPFHETIAAKTLHCSPSHLVGKAKTSTSKPATGISRVNSYPRLAAASPPLQVTRVASSSYQHPPNPPISCIPDNVTVLDAQSSNHHSSFDEDDIVIAVMGLTRAGKTSFANTAAGKMDIVISNNTVSQTQAVQPVRCGHPDGRRNVVLVDTPGFDDKYRSDTDVLRTIANWLEQTYRNNIKLSGLLYLHRISDVRMAGTPLRNLSVFKYLCGDGNLKNIVLVTTMWDEVKDQSVGSRMEDELLSVFWKDMTRLGSRTCRFQGTRESAWEIINCLDLESSGQGRTPLRIPQEKVDCGLQLHETTASKKTFLRYLIQLAAEARKVWTKLRNKNRRKTRPRVPSVGLHRASSRSSTIKSEAAWSVASPTSTSRIASPTGSTFSGCSINDRQDTLLATIRILGLTHQMADVANIPILRGIIRTALRVAQLIQDMGGTHHAIIQVIESSGWLLNEVTQYAMRSELSRDMKRTLNSFQRELNNLQRVVIKIVARSRIAGILLYDADIQVITTCTASIKAVYDKLGIQLSMENRRAIARLESQLTALWESTALRQCECGMSVVPPGEAQEDGRPSASTSQSL